MIKSRNMDFPSLITDVLSQLTCDSCEKHLSYFPIFISGEKKNICGRLSCSHELHQENSARNSVYEALAKFIKFPCRYKNEGCSEIAIPDEIARHEKICDFRVVECPTSTLGCPISTLGTTCDWKDARPTALQHCQNEHSNLMLKNGEFEFDLSESHQCENLLEHQSFLFIVKRKFHSINKLMELSLSKVEYDINVKETPCEITFKTENRCVTIQYCIDSIFDKENTVEVFLDSLKDQNDSLIVASKITVNSDAKDVESAEEQLHKELLAQLKCSSCAGYCLPPIYNKGTASEEGLLLCSDCRIVSTKEVKNPLTQPTFGVSGFEVSASNNSPTPRHPIKAETSTVPNLSIPVAVSSSFGVSTFGFQNLSTSSVPIQPSPSTTPSIALARRAAISKSPQFNASTTSSVPLETKTPIFGNPKIGLPNSNIDVLNSKPSGTFTSIFAEVSKSTNSTGFSAPLNQFGTSNSRSSPAPAPISNAFGQSITNNAEAFNFGLPQNPPSVAKETRNINLDNIANLLNYPCTYEKNGCTFVSKPPEMKAHLLFCLYGDHDCPLNEHYACDWIGLGKEITGHILKSHNNVVLNSSTITENISRCNNEKPNSPISKCYVIKFSNRFFRLNFTEVGFCYHWDVQMIGLFEEGFMFELEVVDRNNTRRSLISKHPCTMLKEKKRQALKQGCYFDQAQLTNLVSDDLISFKVNIYK